MINAKSLIWMNLDIKVKVGLKLQSRDDIFFSKKIPQNILRLPKTALSLHSLSEREAVERGADETDSKKRFLKEID